MAQSVVEKQRAKIRNVVFIPYHSKVQLSFQEGNMAEFARGICLAHPHAGQNGIFLGHIIHTTKVLVKHENGDFETLNTYYEVEKT